MRPGIRGSCRGNSRTHGLADVALRAQDVQDLDLPIRRRLAPGEGGTNPTAAPGDPVSFYISATRPVSVTAPTWHRAAC